MQCSFSNYGLAVDIAAPGTSILSTANGGGYAWMDGTSLASPFVAGAAALLRSRRPLLGQSALVEQLLRGRTPLAGDWSGKTSGGRMFSAGRSLSVKPLTPVISKAPDTVGGSRASFSFFGESGIPFLCSLDGAPWKQCSSPASFDSLLAGEHTFRVRHRDLYGLLSDPVSYTWQVSALPAPVISAVPAYIASRSLLVTLSGQGNITCRLDFGPWQDCGSSLSLSGLSTGLHSLQAFQTIDGQQSPTTVITWKVDLDLPTGTARREKKGKRYLLTLRAKDPSGPVLRVEISGSRSRPGISARGYAMKSYTGKVTVDGPRVPRWARFIDSAGNRSPWIRVS